jgi:hypothetical protein
MYRPILLNSCARAATAAEARFRIDVPIAPSRGANVVALDEGAQPIVRRVAAQPWHSARFFTCTSAALAPQGNGHAGDLVLVSMDGVESRLSEQLVGVDVAVMVATADEGAFAATAIGAACAVRGIMTAGVVLADARECDAAVLALRPHARVLLVTRDELDVSEVLTALRA